MSVIRKLANKTPNSFSILASVNRRFTTQNPKPSPDNPSSAHYDELVNDAGSSDDFDQLHYLLNKRIKDGCFNSNKTFNFITSASLSVLDDLSHALSRLDRGFTRKNAFDSLIARLCKLNRIPESLRMVELMARGDYGLNAATFHPIFNVLTRNKSLEESWAVVDLMRMLNVRVDLTTYNYILMSYCVIGNLAAAADVLRKMEGEGISPDTRTFDSLVVGACKAGKVEGALMLLRRMVDDGVPMLTSSHVFVMDALLEMQYYDQAIRYVMSFSGKDTWLDSENFGFLSRRLIKLKKFEEAKLVLEEMNQRGLSMGDKLKEFYKNSKSNV
ncbi:hypothetical protein L6164_006228 [Bauhinia variegata]|uniref:Uncharacterized protein n=1 Tax=Bauhinia variegata TaxID=167791 RepID=A0ACB9PSZ1_BAUVA|nr:hypothetical protein L6164_006228 [Bauhinia variegata]